MQTLHLYYAKIIENMRFINSVAKISQAAFSLKTKLLVNRY